MGISAILGVFVALGVVLALMLVALRVLKRFSPTLGGSRNRLPMEVVQRLPLGPKHTIAVVRIGDRVLTVAMGEGGVQQLAELVGADRDAVLASSTTPTPFASSEAATTGMVAALAANRDLAALPGGKWIRNALTKRVPALPANAAPVAIVAASTIVVPAKAGIDPFRSVLGMALSSATKLALLGAVLGALAWTPARASAQDSAATRPAAARPVTTNPTALPALPASTQAAIQAAARQGAVRQALRGATAARLGNGRNNQAPAPVGGTTGQPGIAPGSTAPSTGIAAADTMVAKLAPQLDLRMGGGAGGGMRLSGTVGVVIMMGLLTVLPTLILMMTGFTRILIVLHFLKQALGTQNAPPNHLVAAMAILLTGFVMSGTITEVNKTAIQPWLAGQIEQTQMMEIGAKPFREFMLRQTRPSDIRTFVEMSHPAQPPKTVDDVPLVVVMSAFVTSELRTAFQLGFAIYLPFIVIDIVVSSVLLSMGMMMLPPAMISLPCKLLLFVLVDGWSLTVQSLVASFK